MGFDITLLWNFPIGVLRLVTVIVGGIAVGLLTKGHDANLEKEVAALALVSFCCIGTAVLTVTLVSGVLNVSSKKLKKFEFVFAIVCSVLLITAGILILNSVFKDRPSCTFGKQTISPCQESYGLSVAGGTLSLANSVIYGTLSYYLMRKL